MSSEDSQQDLRRAASVILLREHEGEVQLYLLRRHRKASFMSSSYVFPGGIVEEGEDDLRATAIRELYEESGVLLTTSAVAEVDLRSWRKEVNDNQRPLSDFIAADALDFDSLCYFSEWITPSIEKRRYHAHFFLARMPEGQVASPDNRETVDECWVAPKQAIAERSTLRLPPPQLRTCFELAKTLDELPAGTGGINELFASARREQGQTHPLLPRLLPASAVTLVLPWDQEYEAATGDSLPIDSDHPRAWGPARFVMGEGGVWNFAEP